MGSHDKQDSKKNNSVDKPKAAGLRDKHKVIVGCAPPDQQGREYIGADACVIDAVTGVNNCLQWVA